MRNTGAIGTVIRQLSEATRLGPRAQGMARSLRRTLQALVQGMDLASVSDVLLVVHSDGALELRQAGRDLRVDPRILDALLRPCGVALDPNQALLLDSGLAGTLVEAALSALTREESALRARKSRLLSAALVA